jgi:hypothetical protein
MVYDSSNNGLLLRALTQRSVARGSVTAVGGAAVPATVTVTPRDGAAATVNVTNSTIIIRNRGVVGLADLRPNDNATAVYDSAGDALILEVRGP